MSAGPKWQKARIIDYKEDPRANGRTVWVRNTSQTVTASRGKHCIYPSQLCYEVNFWPIGGQVPVINAKSLELLPEGCNDPPMHVIWEHFLAQGEQS